MTGLDPAKMLEILGREGLLFERDFDGHAEIIDEVVRSSRFLVLGGAGAIGSAVVKALFARAPRVLHVVDLSENMLVELVRDVRSSMGYITGEFRTFCLDLLGLSFEAFITNRVGRGEGYDFILNFAALKHVRSEEDPFTLMRLLNVNVLSLARLEEAASRLGARRLFCVSSDKAVNPVSLMGASKYLMEQGLWRAGGGLSASTARFANVAFSDGSLPHGWRCRLEKGQPLSAPRDVQRYFLTDGEAAKLCLLAALVANDREILVPRHLGRLSLTRFTDMAERFLRTQGLEAVPCATEEEARSEVERLFKQGQWPVYFFDSDTTGEKPFEEFVGLGETADWDRFEDLGVVKVDPSVGRERYEQFVKAIETLRESGRWTKEDIVSAFRRVLPGLAHEEKGKYLDARM